MTPPHISEAYEAFKYWMPLGSGFYLVIRAYRSAGTKLTEWADKLLNNHLHHIQEATQNTVMILRDMREDSLEVAAQVEEVKQNLSSCQVPVHGGKAVSVVNMETLGEIRAELANHIKVDEEIQAKILLSLDEIKAVDSDEETCTHG